MKMVLLRNGVEIFDGDVAATIMGLKQLREENLELFKALVIHCRGQSQLTQGQLALLAEDYAFGPGGMPGGGVREIVKCAVKEDFSIGSPY